MALYVYIKYSWHAGTFRRHTLFLSDKLMLLKIHSVEKKI